jgi:hypothetical protein
MPFPAITICNHNPLTTYQAELEIQQILENQIGPSNSQKVFESYFNRNGANLAQMVFASEQYNETRRKSLGFPFNLITLANFE